MEPNEPTPMATNVFEKTWQPQIKVESYKKQHFYIPLMFQKSSVHYWDGADEPVVNNGDFNYQPHVVDGSEIRLTS